MLLLRPLLRYTCVIRVDKMWTTTSTKPAEKMTYDSVLVAEYLRAVAFSKKINLNVTKVQKLLYILYGYFLSKHNRVIINESPKAWPYGPVFPRTRNEVKFDSIVELTDSKFEALKEDEQLVDAVKHVVDKYAGYSAGQLSGWSHSENGPWDKTLKANDLKWNSVIEDKLIKDYFSSLNI